MPYSDKRAQIRLNKMTDAKRELIAQETSNRERNIRKKEEEQREDDRVQNLKIEILGKHYADRFIVEKDFEPLRSVKFHRVFVDSHRHLLTLSSIKGANCEICNEEITGPFMYECLECRNEPEGIWFDHCLSCVEKITNEKIAKKDSIFKKVEQFLNPHIHKIEKYSSPIDYSIINCSICRNVIREEHCSCTECLKNVDNYDLCQKCHKHMQ